MTWFIAWARKGTLCMPCFCCETREEAERHASQIKNADEVGVDEIFAAPKAKGRRR